MSRPTRIAAIELRDFRAYPGGDPGTVISLTDDKGRGKNLLLYGENGSGKSSLGKALRDLLNLGAKAPSFDLSRNAYTKPPDANGNVTLLFDNPALAAMRWNASGRDKSHTEFADMARTRGWLDYRSIWRTTEVGIGAQYVDVFEPLSDEILMGCEMPATGQTFGKSWSRILELAHKRPRRVYGERADLDELLQLIVSFNRSLKAFLPEIEKRVNEFLPTFAPATTITLASIRDVSYNSSKRSNKFSPGMVALRTHYRGELLTRPTEILNEARLTAIGLCLYLAGLSACAPPKRPDGTLYCRVLVLDDVLLSLDMAHRRPLLQLLRSKFDLWQVFLLTHDRAWYELACRLLPDNDWKHVELFVAKDGEYEKPLVHDDLSNLVIARRFLQQGLIKAAAVHVRSEFEMLLKRACEDLRLKLRYTRDPLDLDTGDLWDAVNNAQIDIHLPRPIDGGVNGRLGRWTSNSTVKVLLVPKPLRERVSLALSWVLNPLSHSQTIERHRTEIVDAIDAIGELAAVVETRTACSPWNQPELYKSRDRLVKLLNWGSPEQRELEPV